jgi:ornithine carbamoyltransferase
MGKENESNERKKYFTAYQVNRDLLKHASENVFVMHCLPAHRDEEISSEVIDSSNSIVFDQAENRLHLQKAILEWLMG